jgi:lipoate-protein ligase A
MSGSPLTRWRLIESPPFDGYRNMALDEALLEACAAGGSGFPVLRLYSFSPACVSLGAFQPWRGAVNPAFCRDRGIDLVRRPTGGRAVLHHRELTYAVVGRIGEDPFGDGVREIYRAISAALLTAFDSLGVRASVTGDAPSDGSFREGAVCFTEPSRHEISAGPYKIAGSAQVRRRGAFLQHGSLPLEMDPDLLAGAMESAARRDGAEPRPDVRGLSQILERRISIPELVAAIRGGFAESLRASFAAGNPAEEERRRAEWLRAHRYLTTAWTRRR